MPLLALIRQLSVCVDGAFVSKAIVTGCVIDASANSRLTGRALIVDDLSKKKEERIRRGQ